MLIKVKVLNDVNSPEVEQTETDNNPQILDSQYVRELNRGLSYRLQQIANSHANDINHAKASVVR